MKNKNGITLVALIITIIVMLILVGVTVSLVINSEVIPTAKETASSYKTAKTSEEKMETVVEENGIKYASPEAYVLGEVHDWVRGTTEETRDTLTCTCPQCTSENSEGTVLHIGDILAYTPVGVSGETRTTISADKSGITQAKADNQSWTSSYGNEQELRVNLGNNSVKWAVLGVEDSDGNGTNETLLLTTKEPTTGEQYSTITLYGYMPYNTWIDEANRMAKELYGTEARCITRKDVDNCFQYIPQGAIYYYR